jgi:hypothetical protein
MHLIPYEAIETKILLLRGKKVMLDSDLARLYEVPTKVLLQAVRRNGTRFPDDFMFLLTKQEVAILRSQIVTSSWGGRRHASYVFTEQGVAMLSSILNSERAIQVNIQIMRTFTRLREMLMSNEELKKKVEAMEQKYDHQFAIVFEAIKKLLESPEKPVRKIGFHEPESFYQPARRQLTVLRIIKTRSGNLRRIPVEADHEQF